MAGLPKEVVKRAGLILDQLESVDTSSYKSSDIINNGQLSFEFSESKLLEILTSLNLETMTPLEAITKLYELKEVVSQNEEDRQIKF